MQTVESSSFEAQSMLSIRVAENQDVESPLRSAGNVECSTPIKDHNSTNDVPISNEGLLTYSTPQLASQQQQVHDQQISALQTSCLEYLRKVQLSAIHNSNKTPVFSRRPRVNFHSIDDLASSDQPSESDSGFSSSYSINQTSNQSKPTPLSGEESDSDDIDVENKENNKKGGVDSASGKKVRTTFTEQQKRSLDEYFQRNPYPDPRETEELSQQLVLPESVIKVWFQNKRSRDKQRKFSHKSRSTQLNDSPAAQVLPSSAFQSPLVANLQMLAKFNSYAAVAAAAAAQHNQSQRLYF